MQWFGESWHAPVCQPKDHVSTPIGASCSRCAEIIREADQGIIIPCLEDPSQLFVHHFECFADAMSGG